MNRLTPYLGVLSNRQFLKLWIGQLLSQPTEHILNFLLAIRIYQLTQNSFSVGLLIALVSLPPVIFSVTAGVMADHYNRKWVMVASNLLRAVIGAGFLLFGDLSLAILILAFCASVVAQFFSPCVSATIPTFAKRTQLFQANSIFLFTTYASFLVGYSIAGPMLYFFGSQVTYTILIVAYLSAVGVNLSLPSLNQHIDAADHQAVALSLRGIAREVRVAVHLIWSQKPMLFTIAQLAFVYALERAVIALVPDLAESVFIFNVSEISTYLITPIGVGAFIGVVIGNRIKRRNVSARAMIITGIAIAGMALTLMPLFSTAAVASRGLAIAGLVLLSLLTGIADVVIITAAQTHLHELSEPGMRGRVFGSLTTVMNLAGLPFIMLAGFAADLVPVSVVVFILGVLLLVGAASNYFIHTRYGSARPQPTTS